MGYIYVSEARNECWLQLIGAITQDTVRAFKLATVDFSNRKCSSKWVMLNSEGGSVLAAYQIGKIVRQNGFNTSLMGDGGLCASACGMIFIAGTRREVKENVLPGSQLGFHQISKIKSDGTRVCYERDAPEYSVLLNYASSLLPAEGAKLFVKLASETDCNELSRFTYKQLKDTGLVTGQGGASYRFF